MYFEIFDKLKCVKIILGSLFIVYIDTLLEYCLESTFLSFKK